MLWACSVDRDSKTTWTSSGGSPATLSLKLLSLRCAYMFSVEGSQICSLMQSQFSRWASASGAVAALQHSLSQPNSSGFCSQG